MPRPRQNQIVQCAYFTWRLYQRSGVWYADGRHKVHNLGRHSLCTDDASEARRQVAKLDRRMAEVVGLAPKTVRPAEEVTLLPLEEGRRLYERHIKRPVVTGGLQASSHRKYR